MKFQFFSTSMGMGFHWIYHLRFPSSKFPWNSRAVILGHVSVAINAAHFVETGNFGVHPCLCNFQRQCEQCEPWDNVNNGQCERWSLEMRCDILEGVSSNVSCGSQAKRLWSMPERRDHTEIVNLMMGKAFWLRGWGPKHCSVTMA